MTYTAYGKQVRRGSEHVADAADATWAQIIADALNARLPPPQSTIYGFPIVTGVRVPFGHFVGRQNDEMACSCGLRWGTNEDDPHTTS